MDLKIIHTPEGKDAIRYLDPHEEHRILEVKSVTLVQNGVALFPDAVTARGTRHVSELAAIAREEGYRAALLFVVQREDAKAVTAATKLIRSLPIH